MPRFLIAALAVLTTATNSLAQGIIVPTAGPINSSMAGASVRRQSILAAATGTRRS